MTILVLTVCAVLVILSLVMYQKTKRKQPLFLLLVPLVAVMILVGWGTSTSVFVKSTDLGGEQVGTMMLGQSIEDVEIQLGEYTQEDNVNVEKMRVYASMRIGLNEQNEISYLSIEDPDYETSQGIKVGDEVDMAIEPYGEHYRESKEMGMGSYIEYVDKERNTRLQFWYDDTRHIQRIVYEYTD
ncbi:hypothetical protein [Caldalkalibacillus salinus]|uniref:hypothetical protein n=1 Tax=Caldalkalibacillus salinus TaxID=2803787 RepID=UPI0019225A23|nr:hypothetical protein [Caldalkalibacillus salinus]